MYILSLFLVSIGYVLYIISQDKKIMYDCELDGWFSIDYNSKEIIQ